MQVHLIIGYDGRQLQIEVWSGAEPPPLVPLFEGHASSAPEVQFSPVEMIPGMCTEGLALDSMIIEHNQ
jgi:hypothetical protein